MSTYIDAFIVLLVAFGSLFSIKEFFDIYFERQEMKARIEYIHEIEAANYRQEIEQNKESE